jgi:hypothetical protein
MNECRFCHTDVDQLHPANTFRHRVGLCAPSRNEVEQTIRELEIEDEREQEALRKFWERERARPIISPRTLRVALLGCALILGLLVYVIVGTR